MRRTTAGALLWPTLIDLDGLEEYEEEQFDITRHSARDFCLHGMLRPYWNQTSLVFPPLWKGHRGRVH